MATAPQQKNPYKPGAGHSPPHLAGRGKEIAEFSAFLDQDEVTKNVILTGLRGVGKTVLMDDKYRPLALEKGWAWVGSDFSESSFLSEDRLCTRLITDLSVFSSGLEIETSTLPIGLASGDALAPLTFDALWDIYDVTPGLSVDKLKAVVDVVSVAAEDAGHAGIVFAYDEAQVVTDRADKDEYPLAVLLETFQSLQRKGAKCLLLLCGLPTLFPRLIESRTYAERMFSVQEIGRLNSPDSRDAILVPLAGHGWTFSNPAVDTIVATADGYPYFIQFICRQAFDYRQSNPVDAIPIDPIVRQLDANFFGGRWETLTDRQRDLLFCVSRLGNSESEFTIAEIVDSSKDDNLVRSFTPNDVSQMLPRLIERGLIYKNRLGRYSFAVPLFSRFVNRSRTRSKRVHQPRLFSVD